MLTENEIEHIVRLTVAVERLAAALEVLQRPPAGWVRLVQDFNSAARNIPTTIRTRPY